MRRNKVKPSTTSTIKQLPGGSFLSETNKVISRKNIRGGNTTKSTGSAYLIANPKNGDISKDLIRTETKKVVTNKNGTIVKEKIKQSPSVGPKIKIVTKTKNGITKTKSR